MATYKEYQSTVPDPLKAKMEWAEASLRLKRAHCHDAFGNWCKAKAAYYLMNDRFTVGLETYNNLQEALTRLSQTETLFNRAVEEYDTVDANFVTASKAYHTNLDSV